MTNDEELDEFSKRFLGKWYGALKPVSDRVDEADERSYFVLGNILGAIFVFDKVIDKLDIDADEIQREGMRQISRYRERADKEKIKRLTKLVDGYETFFDMLASVRESTD